MFLKRVLAIMIGLMMLLQTTAVFAGSFNDLKDSEWAESYIEKMASKGIITGFNGAYKPVEPVNKYSAVVMIYRTLKAAGKLDDAAVNAAVSKYSSALSTNNVPAWPDLHQAVAWMLENGVIQQDELKYFMSGENHINARRYELSIFLGKALNVFLKENVNTFISLSFKDANLISSGSAPYVNMLVNKKVLQGDLDGNFKPYDPMTRAAMAKVLSVSYDLIDSNGSITNPTVTPPTTSPGTANGSTIKEGVITYLIPSSTKFIMADSSDSSKSEIVTVDTAVKVYRDGVARDFSVLAKDLKVKLTFQGNVLTRIDSGSQLNAGELTVQSVEDKSGYFIINVTDSDNKEKRYYTNNTLKTATLDGVQKPIGSIKAGDLIQIKVDGLGFIIEISARVKSRGYEGILTSQLTMSGTPKIGIRTDSGEAVSLELSTDVTIKRNDKSATIVDLVVGDYLKVRTSGDKITGIDAYSVSKKTISGNISQIIYSKANRIGLLLDDGTTKDLDIVPTTIVTIDGKSSEIYDLRVNYRAEVDIEGNSVVRITAKKTGGKDQVSGVVVKIYKDLNILTIRANLAGTSQLLSISYNYNTKFISSTGGNLSSSNIEQDKSIFVYGNSQDNFFLAEKVIMLD